MAGDKFKVLFSRVENLKLKVDFFTYDRVKYIFLSCRDSLYDLPRRHVIEY